MNSAQGDKLFDSQLKVNENNISVYKGISAVRQTSFFFLSTVNSCMHTLRMLNMNLI